MVELGGWAITEQVYGLIRFILPSDSTIVEFGSGEGTIQLTRNYSVYSIEHDEDYVGLAPMSHYIHAHIRQYELPAPHVWYDREAILGRLPSKMDLILVDGPPGVIGRGGMVNHLDLLPHDVPMIIDDVNRIAERRLALQIADRIGTIPLVFGDGKRECSLLVNLTQLESFAGEVRLAIESANHRLRLGPFRDEDEAGSLRRHLEENFGWVIYARRLKGHENEGVELVTGVFHGLQPALQRAINLKSEFNHGIELISEMAVPEPDLDEVSGYDPSGLWRQEGARLSLTTPWTDIHFDMPASWRIETTHPDLFKVAEFVLMHPWVDGILDGWTPSRRPGSRPGLAFSGGVDSTAAMLLLPEDTVLIYNERDFDSGLKHANAFRFIDHLEENLGRKVIRVPSDHELIRTHHGKGVGFSTDYACAVQVILLADHFGLDSMATGMPLENAFLFHGYKYRDLGSSWFWRLYGKLFESIGLPILQPVAGCSEVINQRIVEAHGLLEYAQSCLRSDVAGMVCGRCWKCFRKNTMSGQKWKMSPEIDTFLRKRPMKQAASTIYAFQKMAGWSGRPPKILRKYPQVVEFWDLDLKWLEGYLPDSIELLPEKYRESVLTKLDENASPMDSAEGLQGFNLYPED